MTRPKVTDWVATHRDTYWVYACRLTIPESASISHHRSVSLASAEPGYDDARIDYCLTCGAVDIRLKRTTYEGDGGGWESFKHPPAWVMEILVMARIAGGLPR